MDETLKPFKYPINIEIQGEDKCEQLKNYIYTISKQYRSKYEGILPCDVIEVNFREEIPEVYVKEEEFHTNGSPWRQGTLGGVLTCNNPLSGATS